MFMFVHLAVYTYSTCIYSSFKAFFLINHFMPGVSTFGTFHNETVCLQLSSRDVTFECACIWDKLLCHSIKNGDYPESVGSIS